MSLSNSSGSKIMSSWIPIPLDTKSTLKTRFQYSVWSKLSLAIQETIPVLLVTIMVSMSSGLFLKSKVWILFLNFVFFQLRISAKMWRSVHKFKSISKLYFNFLFTNSLHYSFDFVKMCFKILIVLTILVHLSFANGIIELLWVSEFVLNTFFVIQKRHKLFDSFRTFASHRNPHSFWHVTCSKAVSLYSFVGTKMESKWTIII